MMEVYMENNESKTVGRRPRRKKGGCLKWLIIIVGALFLLDCCGAILGASGDESGTEETTEEVAEQTKETEEDVSEEEAEKEKLREDEEEALRLEAINHDIDEYLDENKSFALGTHETSTEANPSFAYSLYIMSLEYDGSALKMQTDAGFIDLSDEDKTFIANSAQNVANVVIGSHEDWDSEDYTQRKFLSVFNGKNALGQSKILDNQEFTWN